MSTITWPEDVTRIRVFLVDTHNVPPPCFPFDAKLIQISQKKIIK